MKGTKCISGCCIVVFLGSMAWAEGIRPPAATSDRALVTIERPAVSDPAVAAAMLVPSFDANVTPDVIFGSGNSNGLFTVDQSAGVELGLRAKIPFTGVIHSNGDGTYTYTLAELLAAFPDQRWNFDWTVNTDWDGSTGSKIDDLTYLLQLDFDPSQGTDFLEFDPITPTVDVPFYDHSIGDNTTLNGAGVEAADAATYAALIAANNVSQQSWRYSFFPVHPTLTYDPTIDGTYDVVLSAFDATNTLVSSTSIQVIVGAGGAPITAFVDDDWTSQADVDLFDPTLIWQFDAFATIQAAIDAVAGSTVNVAAGTYNERLTINKSLTLLGAQAGVSPVPAGARTTPAAESIITEIGLATPNPDLLIEVLSGISGVRIDGFTLNGDQTNATADTSVIRCGGSSGTADNITITNNIMDGMKGVLYKGGTGLVVDQNRVTANKNGVVCQPNVATNATISNNVFTLGTTPAGGEDAIHLTGSVGGSVIGNTATGFINGKGVGGSGQTNLTISGNTFTGNKDAVSFWGNTTFVEICNNTLSDSVRYGISIKGQDVGIRGNVIENSGSHAINVANHTLVTERVEVHCNSLAGSVGLGLNVDVAVSVLEVNAEDNWWGSNSGVAISGMVTAGVDFDPWLATGQIHMACGGNRLVDLQNNDGGWDWPLDDGNPANVSPKNTIGPIGRGLARAYRETGDAAMYAALQNVAALLQTKTNNFSPSDGYLAAELDNILGGTANVDHVIANFYDPLAAGTYDRNGAGTLYSTASYVQLIHDSRSNGGIGNLAAWDIGMGLVGAAAAGADTTAWIAGVKTEIDLLDANLNGNGWYDVIGLAGAVYGLATVGEDFDPTAGEHAAASNLRDLADILVSYQIVESGGFTWNANYVIPYDFNETIQESSYAILALLEVGGYTSVVTAAVDYMNSVQLCTGGWANYVGGGENNEITAEALWAAGLPVKNVDTGELFATIQAAIDDADTLNGHTLEVVATSHVEGAQVVIDKDLTLRGLGQGVTVLRPGFDTTVGYYLPSDSFILITAGVTATIENLAIDGTGQTVRHAIQSRGANVTVRRCDIRDIYANIYAGRGIVFLTGTGLVEDCSMSNIQRIGVHIRGSVEPVPPDVSVTRLNYLGKGDGDFLDYGVEFGGGGTGTVEDSTITDCRGVAATDGSTSAAILATDYFGTGTVATVTFCTLTDNSAGIYAGYAAGDLTILTANFNAISGNGTGILSVTGTTVDATSNWWGDASGPYDDNNDPLETIEVNVCTATPEFEKNEDGTGNSVIDTSTEAVDYCAWLTEYPRVTLEPDADCYASGDTITVGIWMRDVLDTIVGGQFFVDYDAARLQFVSMAPGDAPFTQEISAAHPGDAGAGTIDYGVGVPFGDPGTSADSKMVTLTFTALTQICTELDLITWRAHEPPSRLSDNLGGEVLPLFVKMNVVDNNAPSFAEAAGALDVTIQCDDSTDPADTGTPTPSDNCTMATTDPLLYVDVTDLTGCNGTGTITRTWTATDSCGNASTYVQVITVADTTDPVVFCPDDLTVECDESTDPSNTGTPTFSQGFEMDTYGWFAYGGTLVQVASGTNGVPSASGSWHADTSGSFTRWGAYTSAFPAGGYTTAVDIYLDVSLGLANDTRMDYSSAINDPSGSHRRDFIYTAGFYDSTDMTGPGAGTDRFVMNFSNNAPGWPKNPAFNPIAIAVTGWYTIEHRFYDSGGGVLAVDLNLYDSAGTLLNTWTLSDPTDIIAATVGGNRYGWFLNMGWTLPIDNTVIRRGGSLGFDNCDSAPVVTYSDVDTAGSCPQDKAIARTWTVTDACGNSSSCVQTITVDDSVNPIIGACPADINVNADSGICGAVVTYTPPTATDNCDAAPTVNCDWPSGSAFPTGTTLVTCTASDACGNTSQCSFNVTVNAVNDMLVDVELAGVVDPGPFTRCVTFELWACPDSGPAEIVEAELTFINGLASGTVEVPCGSYSCVTARDTLHTLRRTDDSFGIVGTQYVADFTDLSGFGGDDDSLLGGNHNDDIWIDVLDFGVFTWQWSVSYGSGDTTCATSFPHADVNGDGIVDNLDFSFIQVNFWEQHEANCCGAGGGAASRTGPMESISIRELRRRGLGHLTTGDLNGDGVLDLADIAAFAQGVRPDGQPKGPRPSRTGAGVRGR